MLALIVFGELILVHVALKMIHDFKSSFDDGISKIYLSVTKKIQLWEK